MQFGDVWDTMTTYNNQSNVLPMISPIVPMVSANSNWSIGHQTNSGALTINSGGENVITFHKDGIIETSSGKIHANDWIQVINIMKQFIVDVANDPETSEKYPYIKDMAHTWMIDNLSK